MRPLFFGNLVVVKWHLKFELPGGFHVHWGMSHLASVPLGDVVIGGSSDELLDQAIATQRISKWGFGSDGGLCGGVMVLDQIVTSPSAKAYGAVAANRVGRMAFFRDPSGLRPRFSGGERWINVAKLLRAYGGCLGVRRR